MRAKQVVKLKCSHINRRWKTRVQYVLIIYGEEENVHVNAPDGRVSGGERRAERTRPTRASRAPVARAGAARQRARRRRSERARCPARRLLQWPRARSPDHCAARFWSGDRSAATVRTRATATRTARAPRSRAAWRSAHRSHQQKHS